MYLTQFPWKNSDLWEAAEADFMFTCRVTTSWYFRGWDETTETCCFT